MKRVVVTSSTAAVLHDSPTPKVFSEADWDDQAVEEVEKKGRAASNAHKYRASKTLAERGVCRVILSSLVIQLIVATQNPAAWDFVKKHQSEIGWDLSVINPPLISGVRTGSICQLTSRI